ncbi:MAG: type II secretion system protein M [Gammaproteobacteria bacterium]|nr:type II secretion system protein M [Gammaproteobacteria bacterium]
MNSWWQGLQLREKLILAIAGLIVVAVLVDSLILQEFRSSFDSLDEQVEQANDDLSWMKQAVLRLPDKKKKTQKIKSGRVITYISQQVNRQGLKANMQQMTPIQNHSARLRLSDVEFTRLLKFFSAIDGSILIQEVRLLPTNTEGFVNVSMVLSNGQGDK